MKIKPTNSLFTPLALALLVPLGCLAQQAVDTKTPTQASATQPALAGFTGKPLDVSPTDPDYFIPGRFKGKVILMTGAARGIGRATAIRAAREGATVVVADILLKEGLETVAAITNQGKKAIFVLTDVRRTEDCDRMVVETVKAFDRVDLVVNAAGVMDGYAPDHQFDLKQPRNLLFAPIHEATDEYWDQVLAVNTTGIFKSMRAELRQMLKQGQGGAVVNIGSIAGLTGLAGNPAYVASKHGVTGLTRNAAIDYAPFGIRVNSVNMAATDTPMTESAFAKVMGIMQEQAANPDRPKVANMGMLKTQSLLMYADSKHRMATPWEQASIILFLLSEDASNITGAAWATDGGWTAY
ncbi:MAG: SDR family oxidoreductase [Verrucomicrobia bacterium]|jgi:NAD(P)-dependent dehydrogenase (short-subunit alcohol dehydrogenase family)|nr:SDR family oxidoreductase [Verrucomicrobiota bacterium]